MEKIGRNTGEERQQGPEGLHAQKGSERGTGQGKYVGVVEVVRGEAVKSVNGRKHKGGTSIYGLGASSDTALRNADKQQIKSCGKTNSVQRGL